LPTINCVLEIENTEIDFHARQEGGASIERSAETVLIAGLMGGKPEREFFTSAGKFDDVLKRGN
jgi:hypothetical protein